MESFFEGAVFGILFWLMLCLQRCEKHLKDILTELKRENHSMDGMIRPTSRFNFWKCDKHGFLPYGHQVCAECENKKPIVPT